MKKERTKRCRMIATADNEPEAGISMKEDILEENFLLWEKEIASESDPTRKALLLFDYGKFKVDRYQMFLDERERALCLLDGIDKMQQAVMNLCEIVNKELFPPYENIDYDSLCSAIMEYFDEKERERRRYPEYAYIVARNVALRQLARTLSRQNWQGLYRDLGKFAELAIDRLKIYLG